MRKLVRSHRQLLLTDDTSDSIASHSYRVAIIGWLLAQIEGVDPYKSVMMCLLHDMGEVRTGDHNWLHKRYIKEFQDEVAADQLGTLPFPELADIAREYGERTSKESLVAKDADLLDQVLLLREYAWQGNEEARVWLRGKAEQGNAQINRLTLDSSKRLADAILAREPSNWWDMLWTSTNRT